MARLCQTYGKSMPNLWQGIVCYWVESMGCACKVLLLQYRPHHEPRMVCHSTYQSVVLCHNPEAFPQGSLLVLRRHTFFQIVDKREMRVMQRPRFFHDADAPVEVGGEAVSHVVWYRQAPFGEECLMANEHTLPETLPCQHFGGGEAAHTEEMPFFIN